MNIRVLLASSLVVLIASQDFMVREWAQFKERYKKLYFTPKENNYRFSIFVDTKRMIENHNEKYEAGLASYSLRMNHFGDQRLEEIEENWKSFDNSGEILNRLIHTDFFVPNVTLPESIDWRDKGAVTEVKDKGTCGNSWAYSATAAIEAILFKRKNWTTDLSEQQLIDCAKPFKKKGCNDGLTDNAFRYIKSTGGLASNRLYPTDDWEGECRLDKSQLEDGTKISTYVNLPPGDEETLKAVVGEFMPVSVAISIMFWDFIFYDKGILSTDLDFKTLNHALLVVGYGTENGTDFWLLKNSWGTDWGEDGYVRIARNMKNMMGVASWATVPIP